jgi:hypothetical protein
VSIPARGYVSLENLRLGHTGTIYRQLASAIKFGAGGRRDSATVLEIDESFLPLASDLVQKQRDEAERLALFWAERVGELDKLLAANVARRMPVVEQPKTKPRKSNGPRRVRCAGCRQLYRPDQNHDTVECASVRDRVMSAIAPRTGSGYPGGGVPRR